MDEMLEIIKKYKTPLSHGNDSCRKYLRSLYDDYIFDIKNSLDEKKNPLYGLSMCEKVRLNIEKIESLSDGIIEILDLYEEGKRNKAVSKSSACFAIIKPFLMSRNTGNYRREMFYRIRPYNEYFPLERKELFHIPLSKKANCSSERYSMLGYPCLYLATQAELCWYECKKPKKFAISKFLIPQEEDNSMMLVDFSEKMIPLAHSFYCWRSNEKESSNIGRIEDYLLDFLITYPLRAACSLIAKYTSQVSFKEEYIIPQLLLQWIYTDTNFDGIKYETVSEFDISHAYGGSNVVFVSKGFDDDGYAKNLRNRIKVSTPILIDVDRINLPKWMSEGKTKEQCIFGWGLEHGPDDYEFV